MTINGQVVNKLGETSQSTQNVLVEYIRNDQVRGDDLTNSSSAFTINGIVTGIEEIALANNGFEMKGPNPYDYETRFEVKITEPGTVNLQVEYNDNLGNATSVDVNNYITGAGAFYPTSSPPSELTFKDEIWAAMNDWQDSGGAPPFYDTNGNLNHTGEKVMAVSYLFKPGTEF